MQLYNEGSIIKVRSFFHSAKGECSRFVFQIDIDRQYILRMIKTKTLYISISQDISHDRNECNHITKGQLSKSFELIK